MSCPTCAGVGTVQTPDAATPGRTFTDVCSRCHGFGTLVGRQFEPTANDETKYACPKCGALHDAPVYTADECLFCGPKHFEHTPHEEAAE